MAPQACYGAQTQDFATALTGEMTRKRESTYLDRQRREPAWRKFPAVWGRVPTAGGSLSNQQQILLDWMREFMALMQPHRLYPYVWVVSHLERIVNRDGSVNWVTFCYVSYEATDVPPNAAMVWEFGKIVRNQPHRLRFGKEPAEVLEQLIASKSADLVPIPAEDA